MIVNDPNWNWEFGSTTRIWGFVFEPFTPTQTLYKLGVGLWLPNSIKGAPTLALTFGDSGLLTRLNWDFRLRLVNKGPKWFFRF